MLEASERREMSSTIKFSFVLIHFDSRFVEESMRRTHNNRDSDFPSLVWMHPFVDQVWEDLLSTLLRRVGCSSFGGSRTIAAWDAA